MARGDGGAGLGPDDPEFRYWWSAISSSSTGINRWNRAFFNALERHEPSFVYQAIGLFAVLALAAATVAVLQLIYRMRLQIRWRQWLVHRLASRWLDEQRFYRLSIAAPDLDAPEFRIAEDARIATEPVIDFGYGITNAVLTAVVFFGVLWSASGSATFLGWRIPGFMVYAAIIYSIVMSASMVLFGRALIDRIEQRNRNEAQLRYEMGRVRENAESIAMVGGAEDEMKGIGVTMQQVTQAWTQVVGRQAWLTWLMGGNGVMAPVLPLLLAAPNYLTGEITLGRADPVRGGVRAGAGGTELAGRQLCPHRRMAGLGRPRDRTVDRVLRPRRLGRHRGQRAHHHRGQPGRRHPSRWPCRSRSTTAGS